MGSNGPNISSLMISVSSGTSSKMVGAIFLQRIKEWKFWDTYVRKDKKLNTKKGLTLNSQSVFIPLSTNDDLVRDIILV